MDWDDLARENLRAAQALFALGHPRACVTRCYYAVYCRATWRLASRGMTAFAHGWSNPSHSQLPSMVRANLGLRPEVGRDAADAIELLRLFREDADYRPARSIDIRVAEDCLREAAVVLSLL